MKRSTKPVFDGKSLEELKELAAAFDEETDLDELRPLTAEMQERWDRARQNADAVSNDATAETILVPVDKQLLDRVDDAAHQMGITRAQLIARGLRAVLAIQDAA